MSQRKKSRKTGPIGVSKSSARKMDPRQKKRNKSSGNASGNRNSVYLSQPPEQIARKEQKDHRLGSKTKIKLRIEEKRQNPKASGNESRPRFSSPKEELEYIENDPHFHTLLDKQEQNLTITDDEARYIENCLQRHAILCELLGIESGESEATADSGDQDDIHSGADLLDRLENSDFRQY